MGRPSMLASMIGAVMLAATMRAVMKALRMGRR
jgi:hypothetical protein